MVSIKPTKFTDYTEYHFNLWSTGSYPYFKLTSSIFMHASVDVITIQILIIIYFLFMCLLIDITRNDYSEINPYKYTTVEMCFPRFHSTNSANMVCDLLYLVTFRMNNKLISYDYEQ